MWTTDTFLQDLARFAALKGQDRDNPRPFGNLFLYFFLLAISLTRTVLPIQHGYDGSIHMNIHTSDI